MDKLIKILICFLVFFIFTFSVNAFEFIKSDNNPLPVTYSLGYSKLFQADIYKEGNVYKGILTTKKPDQDYFSLAAFESEDGRNWAMKKEILSNDKELNGGRLFIDKDGERKVLFSEKEASGSYGIYFLVCDSDLNCQGNPQPIFSANINDPSEINGLFAPYIIGLNNTNFLFYEAWGQDGFKIRLAYYDDLTSTWEKCSGNAIIYTADGPFPYVEDNILYLFYHDPYYTGLKAAKTVLPLRCDSTFEDLGYELIMGASYDKKHMIFPSIVKENGGLSLYYTGLGSDNDWHLNLACTGQTCLFPTPTATPTPIIPVVIIPGFLASWNKEALLHNQTVSPADWKLATFVKEYGGLINTFKNLGYEENKNLFVFAYDWRKNLDDIVNDFNNYLNQLVTSNHFQTTNFQIIGHSLGGLVGRIYSQKYGTEKINKLITVASPHLGVAQVYKPVESGEIDRDNSWLWLAEKVVLMLNKTSIETDRQTINNKFPILKDLLPTDPFIKKNNQFISIDKMSIKNNYLINYNQDIDKNISYKTIACNLIYTVSGYEVKDRTSLDSLFDLYPDGRPDKNIYETGDGVVTFKSAKTGESNDILNYNHGEIIYKKEAIKKILQNLAIPYQENQITEGQGTVISPSLIFLIKSPATMEVEHNDKKYQEDDGIVFIDNAESGNYQLKVKGTDQGKYHVLIGQIAENNDLWEEINGEITQQPAESQIDNYSINYNNQTALSIFPTATLEISSAQTSTTTSSTPTSNPSSSPSMSEAPPSSFQTKNPPSPTAPSEKSGRVLGSTSKAAEKKNNFLKIIILSIPILSALVYYLKKLFSKK